MRMSIHETTVRCELCEREILPSTHNRQITLLVIIVGVRSGLSVSFGWYVGFDFALISFLNLHFTDFRFGIFTPVFSFFHQMFRLEISCVMIIGLAFRLFEVIYCFELIFFLKARLDNT